MKTLCALIILCFVPAAVPAAEPVHDFTWDTLLAASVKLQPDYSYEANADAWLQVYRPDVWKFVRNDEFELAAEREKANARFRRQIEDFKLEQLVVLRTSITIGDYNFRTQSFPVKDLDETYFWYQSRYGTHSFPKTFEVYLSNHELVSVIPMPQEEARALLNRRKDKRGNINRRIEITLWVRLLELKPHSTSQLIAEVQAARLFHDRRQKLVLKEIVRPVVDAKVEGHGSKPSLTGTTTGSAEIPMKQEGAVK